MSIKPSEATGSGYAGQQPGGILLSLSLVLTAVISLAADLNTSHLFNPAWPAHAKFHDVAMLNLLIGVCGVGLWLLWRKSLEPKVAAIVAALVPVIFWSAFFWAPVLVPGVSLQAFEDVAPPKIGGVTLYPNAVAAFVFVLISAAGLTRWLRAAQQKDD